MLVPVLANVNRATMNTCTRLLLNICFHFSWINRDATAHSYILTFKKLTTFQSWDMPF